MVIIATNFFLFLPRGIAQNKRQSKIRKENLYKFKGREIKVRKQDCLISLVLVRIRTGELPNWKTL
jgi:hypothetical protein